MAALWRADEGWVLASPIVVGDVNGDGFVDAKVNVESLGGEERTSFVFGPLQRPVSLPQDEDAAVVGEFCQVVDFTHDGVLDVVANNPAELFGGQRLPDVVVPGPIQGLIDPATDPNAVVLGSVADIYADLTGDGRVDMNAALWDPADGEVVGKIWTQPWPALGQGQPDIAFTWSCAADLHDIDGTARYTEDMDGDGIAELWITGNTGAGCNGGMGLAADVSGVVDVPTSLAKIAGASGTAWGDLNADGQVEWRVVTDGVSRYLSGPVVFDGGLTAAENEVVPHASVAAGLVPLSVDLDEDDYLDFASTVADAGPTESSRDDVQVTRFVAAGDVETGEYRFTLLSDTAGCNAYFVEGDEIVALCADPVTRPPGSVRFVAISRANFAQ